MNAETIEGRVLCTYVAGSCRCREDAGHDQQHVCSCGSEWKGEFGTGSFVVIKSPSGVPIPGLEFDKDWLWRLGV